MSNLELDFNTGIAAILGFVVGDALGVPVEFESREIITLTEKMLEKCF